MPLVKPAWPILQRGHSLSRGLIGAWPFYEGSGGTLNDLSGNRNNGSFTNAPAWVGSQVGHSLSFNGSSQRIDIPNAPSLNPPLITIAAWVLSASGGPPGPQYICNKNYDGGTVAYSLGIDGGPAPGFAFFNGAWALTGVTNTIRGDNQWHFIVGSYDGVTLKYYIDTKLDSSLSFSSTLPTTNTQPLYIGEYVNDSAYWQGRIASLLLYNRALSVSEITQLYFDAFSIYRPRRRVPWFTVSGGTGTQNLAPSLFTNTSTFFSPTVGRGAVNLAPSLFTNTSTFFAPTVSSVANLTPSLFTNSNTFFSPTVTSSVALAPSLFTNNSTFFSPTVVGAGNLAPSLFTNTNTFFSPTVGRGVVNLAPTLFANSNIFYSPTVALAQPQALLPSLYTNPNIFFLPVVHSHIVLVNVYVKLKAPHVFDGREWPAETLFGSPYGQPVPSDFQYTPLMEGLSGDSISAIAQTNIDVFGRYDAHGNLLDNPPIPRPIYDPQPTPAVGDKHFLPLGNGSWP